MTTLLLRLTGVGIIAMAMAACSTDIETHDPHFAHPTTVEQKTARLDMGPLYAGKPSQVDEQRINEFLAAYHNQGAAPLDVTVAGHSAEDPAAREQALQLANALMERGVPAEEINLYVQEEEASGSSHLTFPIYVVSPEECGYWDKPLDSDYNNGISSNFGCANQRNIDLMAANPRDLAYPQAMTPGRSGARAFYVIDNYTRGTAIPSSNDLQQDYNFKIF